MSLQSKILQYLNAQPHVWSVKVITANFRGCPDILCCIYGRFLAIEVKEGKDTLSEIQKEQINRIEQSEGEAWMVNDFQNFKERLAFWIELIEGGGL